MSVVKPASYLPSRLLQCLDPKQLEQPRGRPVDQRPTGRVIVPLGTEQAPGEHQGQRLRAIAGQRDGPIGSYREPRRAPDLLDPSRVAMPSEITMARTSA